MKPTYRTALRARGVKPLPAGWTGRTEKRPGDVQLTRVDRPAITVAS